MVSYKIALKRRAEKELRKISSPHVRRIIRKIQLLANDPRPKHACLLRGEARFLRVRQGDYRIVYEVNDTQHEIVIIKIGHRREIYE
jgi:mRNA interferase RelE/StbE